MVKVGMVQWSNRMAPFAYTFSQKQPSKVLHERTIPWLGPQIITLCFAISIRIMYQCEVGHDTVVTFTCINMLIRSEHEWSSTFDDFLTWIFETIWYKWYKDTSQVLLLVLFSRLWIFGRYKYIFKMSDVPTYLHHAHALFSCFSG